MIVVFSANIDTHRHRNIITISRSLKIEERHLTSTPRGKCCNTSEGTPGFDTWDFRIDHCLFSHALVDTIEVFSGMDAFSILHFMNTANLHHYEATLFMRSCWLFGRSIIHVGKAILVYITGFK